MADPAQYRAAQMLREVRSWVDYSDVTWQDIRRIKLPQRPVVAGQIETIVKRLLQGELFTELAADMSGSPLMAQVGRSTRPLSATEAEWLRTDPDAWGNYRAGSLVTLSGMTAAYITSVYLPQRIRDSGILSVLENTDTPIGKALKPLGVHREMIGTWQNPDGVHILYSCARLLTPRPDGRELWPVAVATERVLPLEEWIQ